MAEVLKNIEFLYMCFFDLKDFLEVSKDFLEVSKAL